MTTMEPDTSERDLTGKVVDTIVAVGELSMLILGLGKPIGRRGAVALGLGTASVASKVYNIWSTPENVDPSRRFDDWIRIPDALVAAALSGVRLAGTLLPGSGAATIRGGRVQYGAYVAPFDDTEIGFVADRPTHIVTANGMSTPGSQVVLFCRSLDAVRRAAARRYWTSAPKGLLRVTTGGERLPYPLPEAFFESAELRALVLSLRAFVDRGVPWTVLLDGEPRTGKTTGAVYAAHALGLRAVILEAGHLLTPFRFGSADEQTPLFLVTDTVRPDVLIISDIDRVGTTEQIKLLEILDHIKQWAKLVFVTSNHRHRLLDAIDGPGRIDDSLEIHGLTVDDVRAFAPSLAAHADRMAGWPIAYVANVLSRHLARPDDISTILDEVEARRRAAYVRWSNEARPLVETP